jgi:hypothetical protein
MKSVWLQACAGLPIVAGLVGCDGSENGQPAPTDMRIAVVEHIVNETLTDHAPMGDSAGDVLTFANDLFDDTNKTKVGTDQGYCLRVDVGQSWECNWTAFLERGQITVEGPFFDTKGSTLAITGATGQYSGWYGTMELSFRENPKELNFVYLLETED